jgi:predicted phage terminase large subunit-like protein
LTPLVTHIGPQPGPQTAFIATSADIALYGGAAGGGKTFGLLLEPIRHFDNPKFGGVIFRRNTVQIRNEGGLWDESVSLYSQIQGHPRDSALEWEFPSGSRMKFTHLEYDRTVHDWQGSQIPYIGFDELTHFTEKQLWYMLSRNRSTSGVPGYVRATCNPDADSWVRHLVAWWIGEDGFPIPERSGVIRWFIRSNDTIYWADTKEELVEKHQVPITDAKSFTFISAKLEDNKILMEKDPAYLANLKALSRVERMRLLGGNWNVRASAGNFFQAGWFPIIDAIPSGWVSAVRFWDRAATKPNSENKDPDWTRGLKLLKYPDNTFLVADLRSAQDSPLQIENLIKNTAAFDSNSVKIVSQQDPGSAGVSEGDHFIRMLSGYRVYVRNISKDKATRARPVSAQCEAGNIRVLRAPWNKEFFNELENFPEGGHDDIVDTLSGAFNELAGKGTSILDVL